MADPNNPDNLTVIHTPDGATYSFPNTMSQGDITQALNQHLAAKQAASANTGQEMISEPFSAPVDPVVYPGTNDAFRQQVYGKDCAWSRDGIRQRCRRCAGCR